MVIGYFRGRWGHSLRLQRPFFTSGGCVNILEEIPQSILWSIPNQFFDQFQINSSAVLDQFYQFMINFPPIKVWTKHFTLHFFQWTQRSNMKGISRIRLSSGLGSRCFPGAGQRPGRNGPKGPQRGVSLGAYRALYQAAGVSLEWAKGLPKIAWRAPKEVLHWVPTGLYIG